MENKTTFLGWAVVLAAPLGTIWLVWSQYGIKGAAGLAINWIGLGMWLVWSGK